MMEAFVSHYIQSAWRFGISARYGLSTLLGLKESRFSRTTLTEARHLLHKLDGEVLASRTIARIVRQWQEFWVAT